MKRLLMLLLPAGLLFAVGCASVPSPAGLVATPVRSGAAGSRTSTAVRVQAGSAPVVAATAAIAATRTDVVSAATAILAGSAVGAVEGPTVTLPATAVAADTATDGGASTAVAADTATDGGASTAVAVDTATDGGASTAVAADAATDGGASAVVDGSSPPPADTIEAGALSPEVAAYLQKVEDLAVRITNADELRTPDRMFQETAQTALSGSIPDLTALNAALAKGVTFMSTITAETRSLQPPAHLQPVQAELQALVDDENKHLAEEQAATATPTQQKIGLAYAGAMAPSFDLLNLEVDVSARKTRRQTGMAQLTVDGPLSAGETDYVNKVQALTTRMSNSAELSDTVTATSDAIDTGQQGGTLDSKAFNTTFNKALAFMEGITTETRALQPPPRLEAVQAELLKTVVDENAGLKDSQAIIGTQDWARSGNIVANMARPMIDLMTLGTDLARLGAGAAPTPVAVAQGPTRTPPPTLVPIAVVAGKDLTNFDPCSLVNDEEYKQAVNASTVKEGGTADDTIVVQHTLIADPSEVAGLPGSKACRQAWSSPGSGSGAQYVLFLPYDQLALYRTAAHALAGFEAAGGEVFDQNASTYLNKNGYLVTVGGMGSSEPAEMIRLVVLGIAKRLQ